MLPIFIDKLSLFPPSYFKSRNKKKPVASTGDEGETNNKQTPQPEDFKSDSIFLGQHF